MNGETNVNTGLMNEEEEKTIEKEDNQEKNNPTRQQSTVIMTGEELVKVATPDREMRKDGSGLSELGSSPSGSFQSLNSSREVREMQWYHMYLHWKRWKCYNLRIHWLRRIIEISI